MSKFDFKSKIAFSNKNFCKIISFYLFESPVDNVSFRGLKLFDYGWNSRKLLIKLIKLIKTSSSLDLKKNYITCKSENECLLNIDKIKEINNGDEFIMFLAKDERNTLQSLLKKIRNSFAHGSFNIFKFNKQRYYYLENNDKYVKAKIILKEETLLSWIDIIKKGP